MEAQRLETQRDFNRLCMNNFGKVIVLCFHTEWHEQSTSYLDKFLQLLDISSFSEDEIRFAHLDAELVPEVAKLYNVNSVPTVIVTDAQKKHLKQYDNVQPGQIFEELEDFLVEYKQKFEEKKVVMHEKIQKLIADNPVLIFIKGTPTAPECKFTKEFLGIMKDLECKFTFYDIIADNDMRNWLRNYNNWPTYPQMYVSGELQGGLDMIKQRIAQGVIQAKIPQEAKIYNPEARISKMTKESFVILFTQGNPLEQEVDEPTKQTVQLLKQTGIKFNVFDVSTDQVLQKYMQEQFQVLPQLFSQEKRIGSLQQIQELASQQKLLELIPGSEWELDGEQKLRFLLKNCPVITFINGIPKETHNEESKQMVDILANLNVIYEFYNVDADEEVSANLLKISQYDKTPQLYINGQLIGGITAVQKLFQEGDLTELVKDYVRKQK